MIRIALIFLISCSGKTCPVVPDASKCELPQFIKIDIDQCDGHPGRCMTDPMYEELMQYVADVERCR